jgi:hypothetical protein
MESRTGCGPDGLFQSSHEIPPGEPQHPAPSPEFNDIEAAFTTLALADIGLIHSQAVSQLGLSESGFFPDLLQQVEEGRVFLAVDGFSHGLPLTQGSVEANIE